MKNTWISFRKKQVSPEAYLICIPFAGGGASQFATWQKIIGSRIEILPVQLPAREDRYGECAITDINEAVKNISHEISSVVGDMPFAVFGHSMGGLIAYSLTERLENEYRQFPKLCVISASSIDVCRKKSGINKMNDAELIDELMQYGGIDEKLLEIPDFLKIYLDMIRNDYILIESFKNYKNKNIKTDLRLYSGNKDVLVSRDEMTEWKKYTSGQVTERQFEGNHFFLREYAEDICKDICNYLIEMENKDE